ncbi:uncharacterized protein LOC132543823 [Ylistrum balloti]|uniref:uncharacterized protein LOC132543823 n=1 Tax=Ylistrum balloti TaxID=509963 RepID=UPI002905D374|nr:uncharacterized protein LOC132543823 [Ylistrum balloti]
MDAGNEVTGTAVTGHGGHSGLSIPKAAFFIVGEIAGSGVLALPKAVEDTGWIGLVIITACSLLSAYTGHILGKAWIITSHRFKECRGHVPDPYPLIGEKAYGKWGRQIVNISINFTLFGVGTVFLLLASENIEALFKDVGFDLSFCVWCIILAAILTPVTWLGTPQDFWQVAVGATIATAIACVVLITNIGLESKDKVDEPVIHNKIKFLDFFTAFGTIVFAFGGHPAFPTFQNDMKKQKEFKWAVFLGYLIVLLMYFPVSTAGYFVYGKSLDDNILNTVCTDDSHIHCKKSMTVAIQILITLHLMFGFVIVLNPFCQQVESGLFKVNSTKFTLKRVLVRTGLVALVLFIAETIPHFGAILSLVGGSTTTLLAYVCPSVFYLKLCRTPHDEELVEADGNMAVRPAKLPGTEPDGTIIIPLWEKVLNYEIIAIGLTAGVASTVSAVIGIVQPDTFTVPCYAK